MADTAFLERAIGEGRGARPADLVIKNVGLLDIVSGGVTTTDIAICGDRIVGTYYFYWYDAASKVHVIDGDGTDALTTHPPTLDDFSYKSVKWHRRQLEDMIAAGGRDAQRDDEDLARQPDAGRKRGAVVDQADRRHRRAAQEQGRGRSAASRQKQAGQHGAGHDADADDAETEGGAR